MKLFRNFILGLMLLVISLTVLSKLNPVDEVEAATSVGRYGYINVIDEIKTGVNVQGLGSNIDIWTYTIDGEIAFCANYNLKTSSRYLYKRYGMGSFSSDTAAQNVAKKAVTWYINYYNKSGESEHYRIIAQLLVWGAKHNGITSLDSATTIDYIDTAMASIYGASAWNNKKMSYNSLICKDVISDDCKGLVEDQLSLIIKTSPGTVYYYSDGSHQPMLSMAGGDNYEQPETTTVSSSDTYTEKVTVEVLKTDKDNDKPLSGITFDVYRDDVLLSNGKNLVTDAKGKVSVVYENSKTVTKNATYCTNYNNILPSSRDECSYSTKDAAESAAAAKVAEEIAKLKDVSHTYKVVEKSTKAGYYLNSNSSSKTIKASGTLSFAFTNERQTGKITITKTDDETGKPLSGVVFELYANEDISHPDGSTGIKYKKDAKVATFAATNDKGISTIEDLYLGKYYIKEITPPDGYKLDDTKHEVELASTSSTSKVITKNLDITNGLASISLKKLDVTGKNVLEGVKFELYASKDILKVDGSVVYKKDELVDVFPLTDKEGKTTLSGLIVGNYYIKEISTLDGYELLTKKIEVSIDDSGKVNVLDGAEFEEDVIVIKNSLTKISISKQDMATSKELSGATISICQTYVDENGKVQMKLDENTGECVEAVLTDGTKLTWVSTDKPHVIEGLVAGTYYLVEKIAPNNYSTAESILFTLKEDGTLVDKDGKSLKNNKLVMKDAPIKNEETGSLSTYLVITIVAVVVILGIVSYLLLKKYNNKN